MNTEDGENLEQNSAEDAPGFVRIEDPCGSASELTSNLVDAANLHTEMETEDHSFCPDPAQHSQVTPLGDFNIPIHEDCQNTPLLSQTDSPGHESSLCLSKMFSSTFNESQLNLSDAQPFGMNESMITHANSSQTTTMSDTPHSIESTAAKANEVSSDNNHVEFSLRISVDCTNNEIDDSAKFNVSALPLESINVSTLENQGPVVEIVIEDNSSKQPQSNITEQSLLLNISSFDPNLSQTQADKSAIVSKHDSSSNQSRKSINASILESQSLNTCKLRDSSFRIRHLNQTNPDNISAMDHSFHDRSGLINESIIHNSSANSTYGFSKLYPSFQESESVHNETVNPSEMPSLPDVTLSALDTSVGLKNHSVHGPSRLINTSTNHDSSANSTYGFSNLYKSFQGSESVHNEPVNSSEMSTLPDEILSERKFRISTVDTSVGLKNLYSSFNEQLDRSSSEFSKNASSLGINALYKTLDVSANSDFGNDTSFSGSLIKIKEENESIRNENLSQGSVQDSIDFGKEFEMSASSESRNVPEDSGTNHRDEAHELPDDTLPEDSGTNHRDEAHELPDDTLPEDSGTNHRDEEHELPEDKLPEDSGTNHRDEAHELPEEKFNSANQVNVRCQNTNTLVRYVNEVTGEENTGDESLSLTINFSTVSSSGNSDIKSPIELEFPTNSASVAGGIKDSELEEQRDNTSEAMEFTITNQSPKTPPAKSFGDNIALDFIDDSNMDITNQVQDFKMPQSVEIRTTVSGNPEHTIFCDESISVDNSVINRNNYETDLNNVSKYSTSTDYLRLTNISLDDTSMCAMDYSLNSSQDQGTDKIESALPGKLLEVSKIRLSSTSLQNVSLAGDKSGLMWDSFGCGSSKSNISRNVTVKLSDVSNTIRKLLSESLDETFPEKLEPQEELNLMKSNLKIVLDLLENENTEFEAFRNSCEIEKLDLIEKIKILETRIADFDKDSITVSNQQKLIEDLKNKECELSNALSSVQHDFEKLKQSCQLNEIEINQFSDLFKSNDVETSGIFLNESENVLNVKTVLNILASLLFNHNELKKNYEQNQMKVDNKNDLIHQLNEKCSALHSELLENKNLSLELQNQKSEYNLLYENYCKMQGELFSSKEQFSEILSKCETLEKELISAGTSFQSAQSESVYLSNLCQKLEGDIAALKKTEDNYFDIKKYCDDLNEKYAQLESHLSMKNSEFVQLEKENSALKKDLEAVKSDLENEKKCTDNHRQHLKDEYILLKSRFEELLLFIDLGLSELEPFQHDDIQNDLSTSNTILETSNSEFQSLFQILKSLCSKFLSFDSAKKNLKKSYDEALLKIENLEAQRILAAESNSKLLDDVSGLKISLSDISENFSDLQRRYDTLINKNELYCAQIEKLKIELEELQSRYTEIVRNSSEMEADNLKKSENIKILEDKIMNCVKDINEREENFTKTKMDYNSAISKYESEVQALKKMLIDFSDLSEKYQEVLVSVEKLSAEKEELSKTNAMEQNSLLEEVQLLNEKLSSAESIIQKLNKKSEDEVAHSQGLTEEINDLKSSLSEISEKLSILQSNYDSLLIKNNSDCTELHNLHGELSKIRTNLEENVRKSSELVAENSEKSENIKVLKEQIINLEETIKERENNLSSLKIEYDMAVSKYESGVQDFNKMSSDFSDINKKYQESVIAVGNLTAEKDTMIKSYSMEKKSLMEEIEGLRGKVSSAESRLIELSQTNSVKNEALADEISKLNSELNFVNNKYSDLKIEYDSLVSKYDIEQSQNSQFAVVSQELRAKYEEILKWLKDIENLSSQLSGKNDIISDLRMCDLDNLTPTEALNKIQENNSQRFENAFSNLKFLEVKLNSYEETKKKLENDCTMMKEELALCGEKFSSLEKDYDCNKTMLEHEAAEAEILRLKIKEFENSHLNLSSELSNLRESHTLKISELEQLAIENATKANEISKLNEELKSLNEELTSNQVKNECLSQEILSLKDSLYILNEQKTLKDEVDKVNSELQTKCETYENDLTKKIQEISSLESENVTLKERVNDMKQELDLKSAKLSQEISTLSANVSELNAEIEYLKLTNSTLEKKVEQKHSELHQANLKIDYFNNFEEFIHNLKCDYPFFEDKMNSASSPGSDMFDVFFSATEEVFKEFMTISNEYSVSKSQLTDAEQKLENLVAEMGTLRAKLQEIESQASALEGSNTSLETDLKTLREEYSCLKNKYNNFEEQFSGLNSQNIELITLNENLTQELYEKSQAIRHLEELQKKYDSLILENNKNMNVLSTKSVENENMKRELSSLENNFKIIKSALDERTQEAKSLLSENETLKNEFDKMSSLYTAAKENVGKLEADYRQMKLDKNKCERKYQECADTLRKTQFEMCELEKKCDEKMSRFTFVLQEKEKFENEFLSLMKERDDLALKQKDLLAKIDDYETIKGKLAELQVSVNKLRDNKIMLEKQISEYEDSKREIRDLKASLAVKDSKINDIVKEIKQLKNNLQLKSEEYSRLLNNIISVLPDVKDSLEDPVEVIRLKLSNVELVTSELEEERQKCKDLDEECDILNENLKRKDKTIGEILEEHSREMEAASQSISKLEKLSDEQKSENSALKEEILQLKKDLDVLKTAKADDSPKPSPCTTCSSLEKNLQSVLAEKNAQHKSFDLQLEEFRTSYKKKVLEYHKKIKILQNELASKSSAAAGGTENKENVKTDRTAQTEPGPAPSTSTGLSTREKMKLKELEEKVVKLEKEKQVLKKINHNRLQKIHELESKDPKSPAHKKVKSVLSEVQEP